MGKKKCPFCAEKIQAKAIKCRYCGSSLIELGNNSHLQKQKKKSVIGRTAFLAIIVTIVVCFILLMNEQQKAVEGTSIEKLQNEVKRVLDSSNRGINRLYKIEDENGKIQVDFAIDDNLTSGMTKSGAKIDILRILKAAQSSACDYSEVVVIGTYALPDEFGNSKETQVIKATYKRNTIDRIDWEGFLFDNVYSIADTVWIHSTFQ